MFKTRSLFLLAASLMLTACATSPQPLPQQIPPLDTKLAEPCATIVAPTTLDYDLWQMWVQNDLLRAYGECAARHAATVKAWPK